MNIKRTIVFRILMGILIFSISLTSVGVTSTQASQSHSSSEVQEKSLTATLDRSVNVESFPTSGAFIVHFNDTMNKDGSQNPLLTYPYVNGNISWNSAGNMLTFIPVEPLKAGETYTFFIDPALNAADGRIFDSSPQWQIQVHSGTHVTNVAPEPGLLKTRRPVIQVRFDRPMDRTSTENSFSVQPNLPHTLSWMTDREIQIHFGELFQYGQQYHFLFAGGSAENAARDENGTSLAEDFSWSYGLEEFSIEIPPTGQKSIWVNFSHELDADRTGFPFVISPPLDGVWRWQGNKTALFTTIEEIPSGQVYSLGFTDSLFDADGEIFMDATSFNFVAPPPFSIEPQAKGNPVAAGYSPIKITFETEINRNSAEKAFSITPQVPGRFEWSKSNDSAYDNVLSFYPGKLLQYDTQYTIQLDTGLTNSKGTPLLLEPYTSTFRTSYEFWAPAEGASFGYGSKIQIVDVLGSRRIQFGSGESEPITFEAYAYELIDFASLYAEYSRGNGILTPTRAEKEPVAIWNYVEVNPDYQETIIPTEVPSGLYVLNLRYGRRSFDQLFVALTRNTIVAKRAGDDLFVWLTNINGGDIAEAEIRVYSDNGEKIREGKTDENGLYRVSIPDEYSALLVSARSGEKNNDVVVTGLDDRWQEYSSGFWSRRSEGRNYLAYIYTDRPIYRPGQTVNFKAILRRDNDLKYEVPEESLPITVHFRDAKNNLLQTSTFNTNEFGTINGTFTIANEAALGDYEIETVVNNESSSQTFKVQDYRKPDFSVSIAPSQGDQSNKFVNQDKINLTVKTEYFFGEPVANAKLNFKIYRLVPQYYWWDWDASATDVSYSWYTNAYDPGISRTTTDVSGRALIEITAQFAGDYYWDDYDYWNSSLRSRTYAIEVTADDGSNQPVSSAYIFDVYNSNQKTTLDLQGYFKQANQPFTISINTKSISDEPLGGRDLELQINSWNSQNFNFDQLMESYSIKTDRSGLARQELNLPAGYYQLVLRGEDTRGTSVTYERWLRVLSSSQQWEVRYWDPISISAEQDEYKPYETARFAIESNVSGPALLTFERGSVIHSKFINLTEPLTVVEAEIIPEDAPNVFVTVNAWAPVEPPSSEEVIYYRTNIPDSELMMATTELKVAAQAKKLEVDIATDKQTYSPGEEVTVIIDVKDSNAKPVLAEVSLALVDESIFSLSNELAPNIFATFYGPRNWTVSTYTSMSPSRVIYDGGGRGGGGDSFTSSNPRSDFQDTAAWFPALRTDSAGRATITFALPDNLTSWRLSAKAITLNHLVGQSHTNIETKKDLLIRPLLPRILTTGDQAQLTAMVHNYSEAEQKVRVTLNAPGLKVNGDATQTVTIKANEVQAVGWAVIPEIAKETDIMFVAVTDGDLEDSISLPLPVQPLAVKDVQSISGKFNGYVTLPLPLPPDVMPEMSAITLKLSRTPASTILDGLEYLTGYPYGCVEQTMSRAMPNAVLGRASAQLGIGGEEFQSQTRPLIEASIQKLYGLQHSNGGWGWWYDDYSDAYQTAWVLHGLSNIRDAGYFIDPQVLERGSKYLANNLDGMDVRTRAYALYSMALAGYGNLDQTIDLMNTSLTQLDPFSQAALALTFHHLGEKSHADITLNQLQTSVNQKGDLAYWPQSTEDGQYHRKTMSSTIRTTAMALSAFMQIQGTSPLTDSIANYLTEQRTGYGWGTTNETSFTILALTDYLSGKQEYTGSSDFTVEVNNNLFTTGTLQGGNLFTSIDIPIEDVQHGLNNIKLSTSGIDPLYYDIITSYTTQKSASQASGNITLTRRYLDPKTNKPLESISEGQLVKVELFVNMPEDASFVIVEDHLPGGLEALNEGLSSTTQDTIHYEYDYYDEIFFWQDYGYNYKEIHGDRVSFFITELTKGTRIFKYLARATMSGTFTALPAEAYAMYDEQIWGRSSSSLTVISPR